MNDNNYGDMKFLKTCLYLEVIKSDSKKFSWFRTFRRYWKNPDIRYIFWWRVASYLHNKHEKKSKLANYINRKITYKYGSEISLDAKIKPGLSFSHYTGVVITGLATIGCNFHVRQNTTIGVGGSIRDSTSLENAFIKIGDNVEIGANSCIIGNSLTIGDNVVIGAMSFINKDIPDNCTAYSTKQINIIEYKI